MSIVVSYGPEGRGRGGLELARLLSDSSGQPVLICCVIPDRWQGIGGMVEIDRDYQDYLQSLAHAALDRAREALGPVTAGVDVQVVTARSAPAGLVEVAERSKAWMLVTGSSADGSWGHVALGSVTDRLLHSCPVPVAIAPRGYRCHSGQTMRRITVAVDGSESTGAVLRSAAEMARGANARLRVVTFAVRTRTMYPPELGLHIEERVIAAWRQQAAAVVDAAIAELPADHRGEVEQVVAEATTWRNAIEEPGWAEGDVLVLGSSTSQSLVSRVFLGSTATRILRYSPVPVIVVP